MFQVIDRQTGAVVSTCKTIQSARRVADRKDNQYGGYRYTVRPVAAPVVAEAAAK